MGFGGFQEACNRCPLVVHPIMRLQEAMQMRTLGADRWKRLRDDYGGDFLCGNQPVCRLLGDDAAVLAPSSNEEPASPPHRAGVASREST